VAERFSFSKSTRREDVKVWGRVLEGEEEVSVREERSTLPRVKPEPMFRVTEIILPVKRRMPRSDFRRAEMGSSFWERERAMERPIDHAGRLLVFRLEKGEGADRVRSCCGARSWLRYHGWG
jgi:hypothetical protein